MEGKHLRLFVVCGTGAPFPRLLHAIEPLLGRAGLEVFAQRGGACDAFEHIPGQAFISREEFETRLRWADVVVCHGGAGTLHQAWVFGHTPICMPRTRGYGEHVNDHQEELVQALESRQLAIWLHDPRELGRLLESAPVRRAERTSEARELSDAVSRALRQSHSTATARRRRAVALPQALCSRFLTRLARPRD